MPSKWKSTLGSVYGSVGIADQVELLPTAPHWFEIPFQQDEESDLPVSLNLNSYVTGRPRPIITTDYGEIEDGVLTLPVGTPVDVHTITVTATNSEGTDISSFQWEIVETIVEVPPTIITQPQDTEAVVPERADFTVIATHPDSELYYEWEGSQDGSTWVSPELVASDVDLASITTNTLVLNSTSVGVDPLPPYITAHPTDREVIAPEATFFRVVAEHLVEDTLYYEWEASDDGSTWQDPTVFLGSRVNAASILQPILLITETEA